MGSVPVYGVRLVQEGRAGFAGAGRRPTIRGPRDAAEILRGLIGEYDREAFAVLLLEVRHRVIGVHLVAVGAIDSAPVHPRGVFKAAILANAAAVILGHNHPSGSVEPSADDRRITTRLTDAGQILGIEVLDHVIVASSGAFVSLREGSGRAEEEWGRARTERAT